MSKTLKEYKGKKYKAKDPKKRKDKKHFGETSGSHSNKLYNYIEKDGRIVKQRKGKDAKADEAPVKGKDFIKYGYPFEMRKGKVVKNLQKEREADNELKKIKKTK
jgi:hypothetical protein